MAKLELSSPVTGTIWKIERSVGEKVAEGDTVLVLESMKMEIPLEASTDGVIVELRVKPGDAVDEEQILCVMET